MKICEAVYIGHSNSTKLSASSAWSVSGSCLNGTLLQWQTQFYVTFLNNKDLNRCFGLHLSYCLVRYWLVWQFHKNCIYQQTARQWTAIKHSNVIFNHYFPSIHISIVDETVSVKHYRMVCMDHSDRIQSHLTVIWETSRYLFVYHVLGRLWTDGHHTTCIRW